MEKYFAISDIHSFYEPMIKALHDKNFDITNPEHIVIVLGDAFDRGDDTIKVFEFLKDLSLKNRLIYIRGNHEDLFFDCYQEIMQGKIPGTHHFHNKTVKTICMLAGENEWLAYNASSNTKKLVEEKTQELRNFITSNSINYFELGNKIFVHSWIPLWYENEVYPLWNVSLNDLNANDLKNYSCHWSSARWGNPFLLWKQKLYPEGRCIVFGHFHTSYGHSRIDMKYKEWP